VAAVVVAAGGGGGGGGGGVYVGAEEEAHAPRDDLAPGPPGLIDAAFFQHARQVHLEVLDEHCSAQGRVDVVGGLGARLLGEGTRRGVDHGHGLGARLPRLGGPARRGHGGPLEFRSRHAAMPRLG